MFDRQANVVGNQADPVPTNASSTVKTVDSTLVGDIKKNAPAGNSNWQELVKQANSISHNVPPEVAEAQARVTVKVIVSFCMIMLLRCWSDDRCEQPGGHVGM